MTRAEQGHSNEHDHVYCNACKVLHCLFPPRVTQAVSGAASTGTRSVCQQFPLASTTLQCLQNNNGVKEARPFLPHSHAARKVVKAQQKEMKRDTKTEARGRAGGQAEQRTRRTAGARGSPHTHEPPSGL